MRTPRVRLASIVGLSLGAIMLLPGGAAAASSLAIYVPRLGGPCIFITAPANKTLTLTWKDTHGALKESQSIPTGSAGDPDYCSTSNVVEQGDSLSLQMGAKTHELVVPNLTVEINRETDTMTGHAPAGATLRIECGGSPYGGFEPCQYTKNVTANGSGDWSKHIPFDLFGGFMMDVRWHNASGDVVYVRAITPYFEVFVGQSTWSGFAAAHSQPSILVENSSSVQKGTNMTTAGPDGAFSGTVRNNANHKVNVQPGDHVSSDIAGDAEFDVPTISATANVANDHVKGVCQTDGVFIQVLRGGELIGSGLGGENDGTFNVDFGHATPTTRKVNIKTGDQLLIKCIEGPGDYAVKVIVA